jgi:hypothetical protein
MGAAVWGMAAEKYPADEMTAALVHELASRQDSDGPVAHGQRTPAARPGRRDFNRAGDARPSVVPDRRAEAGVSKPGETSGAACEVSAFDHTGTGHATAGTRMGGDGAGGSAASGRPAEQRSAWMADGRN